VNNKKIIFLYLAILLVVFMGSLVISLSVEVPSKESIYGIWEGGRDGKSLLFRFNNNGTCTFSLKDNTTNYIETLNGVFEVDFSKHPLPLTIRNIPQLDHPLHTIIKFIGLESIEIAPFAERWRLRPVTFDSTKSVVLKKIDEKMFLKTDKKGE